MRDSSACYPSRPDSCRPFDRNRRGLVLGEGCGMLLLERERERNSQKNPWLHKGNWAGIQRISYDLALTRKAEGKRPLWKKHYRMPRCQRKKIDCVIAHGTGTKANDRIESIAIQQVFGQQSPYVCSVKSMLGHSMGAASTLAVIAGMLMMQKGYLLPTANYETEIRTVISRS
ncbi:MAG: beta-ketoacyl synthase N-terminal-like domain-containing protein [Clostridia bacterium]